MKLIVDQAIFCAQAAFSQFGEIQLVPGQAIDASLVKDADALIVRTVTRVDEALLAGSSVSQVATATAGVDHVDQAWLAQAGIGFASAAGCNATAVAQYVVTALHLLALERDPSLLDGPVAVIGFGHVGRRVTALLRSIGTEVIVCDPPLARAQGRGEVVGTDRWSTMARAERFHPLADVLPRARVLSLHVPLHKGGLDGTLDLIDDEALAALPKGAVIINTSRGEVIDESALTRWLQARRGHCVLDVWRGEPSIELSLLAEPRLRLATPHVAGYTVEGKVRGTSMVAEALARAWGRASGWDPQPRLGPTTRLSLPEAGSALARRTIVLRRCNPIEAADGLLRGLAADALSGALPSAASRARAFESLRSGYVLRREFDHFALPDRATGDLEADLMQLGFSAPATRRGSALVLIAHGSRDPNWRIPLEALQRRLATLCPDPMVELAYLEHTAPSLAEVVARLHSGGVTRIQLFAVFLSSAGNHLRRDIPALVQEICARHPGLTIAVAPEALGAEHEVIEAMAQACLRMSRG